MTSFADGRLPQTTQRRPDRLPAAIPPIGASPILRRIGLFVTVALIGAAVVEPATGALAVALHMTLRIYDGRFGGWRGVTWLVLVIAFVLFTFGVGFLRYVLPSGQIAFWLAAHVGPAAWSIVQGLNSPALIGALLGLAVIADVVALHAAGFRIRRAWRTILLLIVFAVAPGILSDLLRLSRVVQAPAVDGLPTPEHIIPNVEHLPIFAILRAPPSKGWGVALVAVVLLLPIAAVWTRAWRFHAPQTRPWWALVTVGLLTSWIGLGLMGAWPALDSETTRWAVYALIGYQAAFFLVLPVLLGRIARPADGRALVFD